MSDENLYKIDKILKSCGMPIFGVAAFDAVSDKLIRCGAMRRLPQNAKSIIAAVFPYYSDVSPCEISRYAMPPDYHVVAGEMLKSAASKLRESFAGFSFEPFCDASPIPEVYAARLAGLGVQGRNGLLITPRFGSFVFIGEIVTDLEIAPSENPGGECIDCGRCAGLCPSGAISQKGVERTRCVSEISQKKGELSDEERALLRKAGTVWGCDICQNVCPMNKNIETTYIEKFKSDIINSDILNELDNENFENKYACRAFMWRGKKVLQRNKSILQGDADNNINVED